MTIQILCSCIHVGGSAVVQGVVLQLKSIYKILFIIHVLSELIPVIKVVLSVPEPNIFIISYIHTSLLCPCKILWIPCLCWIIFNQNKSLYKQMCFFCSSWGVFTEAQCLQRAALCQRLLSVRSTPRSRSLWSNSQTYLSRSAKRPKQKPRLTKSSMCSLRGTSDDGVMWSSSTLLSRRCQSLGWNETWAYTTNC